MTPLSPIETKILARLRRAHGGFVTRRKLAAAVYGDPGKVAPLSSAVARLRKKGLAVETKRGEGYRLAVLSLACVPAPIADVAAIHLPPTLSQGIGPMLVAGVRGLARRYALAAVARRVVAFARGRRHDARAVEFLRGGDGVYELPPK